MWCDRQDFFSVGWCGTLVRESVAGEAARFWSINVGFLGVYRSVCVEFKPFLLIRQAELSFKLVNNCMVIMLT